MRIFEVDYSYLKWRDERLGPYRSALENAERAYVRASRNVDYLISAHITAQAHSDRITPSMRVSAVGFDDATELERSTRTARNDAKRALLLAEAFYTIDNYYNERRSGLWID